MKQSGESPPVNSSVLFSPLSWCFHVTALVLTWNPMQRLKAYVPVALFPLPTRVLRLVESFITIMADSSIDLVHALLSLGARRRLIGQHRSIWTGTIIVSLRTLLNRLNF